MVSPPGPHRQPLQLMKTPHTTFAYHYYHTTPKLIKISPNTGLIPVKFERTVQGKTFFSTLSATRLRSSLKSLEPCMRHTQPREALCYTDSSLAKKKEEDK